MSVATNGQNECSRGPRPIDVKYAQRGFGVKPYWDNGVTRLYASDARSSPLPDESVHCVVTSPPYFGLRDYGLEPSVWGGDPDCSHEWGGRIASHGGRSSDNKAGPKQLEANRRDAMPTSAFCHCGAWRGTLGLEPRLDCTLTTSSRYSVRSGGCCVRTARCG